MKPKFWSGPPPLALMGSWARHSQIRVLRLRRAKDENWKNLIPNWFFGLKIGRELGKTIFHNRMLQISHIFCFCHFLAIWGLKILIFGYFDYFEVTELRKDSKYGKFVTCDCVKWFFQCLYQFLAQKTELGLSFFNFRLSRVEVGEREFGYVWPMSPLRREGGVPTKILVLCDFGSKFSVLSHPFYRIWKFRPLGPKFPDLSGWVGAPRILILWKFG